MPHPIPPHETRSREQLREQFEVERGLAARLKTAGPEDRRRLYGEVYDEFFRRLPHLPQHTQKTDPKAQKELVHLQAAILQPFLTAETSMVEIGSGDCALAIHLSHHVHQVTVVEASAEIVSEVDLPTNVSLEIAEAPPFAMPTGSADLAFSCHFIEHLHPDDALTHLQEVLRILRPGGVSICVTPNRIYGPHDISRYFVDSPQGLHLREYSHGDLARLHRRAGFRRIERLRGIGRPPQRRPVLPAGIFESLIGTAPAALRRFALMRLAGDAPAPFRPLEQVILLATA